MAGAVALGLLLSAASASAAITPNPWLARHFLNIAHQGGEDEVPSNTMYAFKSAMREGHADMLETDVHLTGDGVLVTSHDDTYTRTACTHALCPGPTDATGPQRPTSQLRNMTLAQLQQIDLGYWFRPGTYSHDYTLPDSAFPYRGIATGDKAPPAGYTADDFKVTTVKQLLDTFPDTPINLEIKMPKSQDPVHPYSAGCGNGDGSGGPSELCDDLDLTMPIEQALADLLTTPPYSQRDDIIVVSFAQPPMVEFANDAPLVHRAPSQQSLVDFAASNNLAALTPDPVAFQVPPDFGGIKAPQLFLNPPFSVHQRGYAVHVWTNGDQDETTARYQEMLDIGVDGIMTTSPRKLDAYLCQQGVPHPNGVPRCATPAKKKKCKKHKKGKGKAAAEAKKKGKKKKKCGKKKRKKGKR